MAPLTSHGPVKWIVAHSTNALLSALGFYMVWTNATFATKPWQCRQSDVNECVDERAATFLDLLGRAIEERP